MSFHSGYGGGVIYQRPGGNVNLCVGLWTLTRKVDIEKRAHAGSQGVKVPIVGDYDYSGTVELPFDDDLILETLGLYEGQEVRLKLKLGSSIKYLYITVIVETLAYKVDNATGAVMQVVNWQGASPLTGPRN